MQLGLFAAVQNLLLDRIVWFLRNVDLGQGLAGIVDHYRSGIAKVQDGLDRFLPPEAAARAGGRDAQDDVRRRARAGGPASSPGCRRSPRRPTSC